VYTYSGMSVCGFFKSPDIFAPAMIPVTAGKYTPNTVKNVSPSTNAGPKFSYTNATTIVNMTNVHGCSLVFTFGICSTTLFNAFIEWNEQTNPVVD
jgi:hypothetical protein